MKAAECFGSYSHCLPLCSIYAILSRPGDHYKYFICHDACGKNVFLGPFSAFTIEKPSLLKTQTVYLVWINLSLLICACVSVCAYEGGLDTFDQLRLPHTGNRQIVDFQVVPLSRICCVSFEFQTVPVSRNCVSEEGFLHKVIPEDN